MTVEEKTTLLSYVVTVALLIITTYALTGCGGFKVGIYGERVDTIETRVTTTAPKMGMADAVYNWLFVDSKQEKDKI